MSLPFETGKRGETVGDPARIAEDHLARILKAQYSKPHRCDFTIEGPKSGHGGRGLAMYRKNCKRVVTDGHEFCWQHRPLADRYGY